MKDAYSEINNPSQSSASSLKQNSSTISGYNNGYSVVPIKQTERKG